MAVGKRHSHQTAAKDGSTPETQTSAGSGCACTDAARGRGQAAAANGVEYQRRVEHKQRRLRITTANNLQTTAFATRPLIPKRVVQVHGLVVDAARIRALSPGLQQQIVVSGTAFD